ncbi:MAG: hypothetical protein ACK4YY_14375 [Dolichospermum sp.]
MKNCRYSEGTGNREQGTGNREQETGNRKQRRGFGQLYFSLLMSVFSVHLLTSKFKILSNIFFFLSGG